MACNDAEYHAVVLARNTRPPPKESPVEENQKPGNSSWLDDLNEEPDEPVPRLSLAVNELENDDSFHEAPPRLSMALDDENNTVYSVEEARRSLGTHTRNSFGLRLSERYAALDDPDLDAGPGAAYDEDIDVPQDRDLEDETVRFDSNGEPILE